MQTEYRFHTEYLEWDQTWNGHTSATNVEFYGDIHSASDLQWFMDVERQFVGAWIVLGFIFLVSMASRWESVRFAIGWTLMAIPLIAVIGFAALVPPTLNESSIGPQFDLEMADIEFFVGSTTLEYTSDTYHAAWGPSLGWFAVLLGCALQVTALVFGVFMPLRTGLWAAAIETAKPAVPADGASSQESAVPSDPADLLRGKHEEQEEGGQGQRPS